MELEEALIDLNTIEPRIVKLVEEGEIDPWDIDIAKLCDIYMEIAREDLTLRKSGNALIVASVLLNLKSKIFEERPKVEILSTGEVLEVPDIELKLVGREVRRKITIFELLDALKRAFEEEKRKVGKRRRIAAMQFYAYDIEKIKQRVYDSIGEKTIVSKVGALALFAFLSLATEQKIRIEQEEWNGDFIAERT